MGVTWMVDPFAGYRQRLLHDLAEAFADHDAVRFLQLTAPERAEQLRARLVPQSYLGFACVAGRVGADRPSRSRHRPECVPGAADVEEISS